MWPGWGMKMGSVIKRWDEIKERSWPGEDGLLTKDDLGLSAEKFVDFKGTLAEMDWNALL